MLEKRIKSEELYLTILKSIGDGVIVTDIDANIVFMNNIAERLTNWSKSEAIDKPIELVFNIINEETLQSVENPVKKVLRERHVVGLANHSILIGKDGNETFIDDSGSMVTDENGNLIGVVLIFRDIGQRRKIEQKLKMKSHNLGERVKELSCLYNISRLAQQTNLSIGQFFEKIIELIPPAWQYPEITCVKIVIKEQEFKSKNFSSTRWVQKSDITEHGKIVGNVQVIYLKKMREIDEGPFLKEERNLINTISELLGRYFERKEVEKIVINSEKKYKDLSEEMEMILDHIPGLVFYKDAQNHFLRVNKYLADAQNMPKEALIGKSLFDLYKKEEAQAYWDDDLEVIRSGNPKLDFEEPWNTPEGDKWVSTSKIPYKDKDGNVTGIIGISSDITKRKNYEIQLLKSEEKYFVAYNRAEFYKDLFAHDINNILQSIITALDIQDIKFKELKNPKEFIEINNIMKEQVTRGAKLVSNIRKLSLIEEKEINLQKTNFIHLLQKSINFIKKSFKHQDIEIQVKQEENSQYVKANELLEDVFENILINGVKYIQNPKKELFVRISDEKRNNIEYVRMEFIDNGIGIPDSIKGKIFERSFNEGRSIRGMGLGLSLVKKIIETYSGDVWVENKVEEDHTKGSKFVILIPVD